MKLQSKKEKNNLEISKKSLKRKNILKNIIFAIIFIIALFSFSSSNMFKALAAELHITLTPKPEKNAIDITWNADGVDKKKYKVWQKSPGATEFETIGTLDYEENEQLKVLNIYPLVYELGTMKYVTFYFKDGTSRYLPKSASLKVWMEGGSTSEGKSFDPYGINPETGEQLITVDLMSSTEFNNNPEIIMDYDVIMFGTWDANGSLGDQPTDAAIRVIEEYIKSGKGIFGGHDTIGYIFNNRGLSKLRKYFNIETGYSNYNGGPYPNIDVQRSWQYYSDNVEVLGKGFLTKFPWTLNSRLTVPITHSNANAALGKVWMQFINIKSTAGMGYDFSRKGNPYYYLTTYNNTAMIQTGHSNCESTEDERKVLANTLFYLKQVTERNYTLDHSATDIEDPNPVSTDTEKYYFGGNSDGTTSFVFDDPGDNGSTYEYYVENITDGIVSQRDSSTITTGVKGYAYILDENPNTTSVGTTVQTSSRNINLGTLDPNKTYWIHMRTIDGAGNYSEVTHFKIAVPQGKVTITKTDSVTGKRVEGATFGLYEWDGSTYVRKYDLTDEGNGIYKTPILMFSSTNKGQFRVEEDEAPEHYYESNWYENVSIVTSGVNEIALTCENIPYPKAVITLNKTDNVTEETLNGAVFGLYEWNGTTYVKKHILTDRNNGSYITQEIEYSPVNQGKFKIIEERAPEHYYGYDDRDDSRYRWQQEFVLSDPGYHEYSYSLTNTPYPRSVITIHKTDSVTGESLDQAIFGLYEWNGSDYNRRETLTDNHDGSYTTSLIEYSATNLGKFKIVEEQAPLYYTNPRKDIVFTLTEPGYHEYSHDIQNEPNKVIAKITKIDEETNNKIKGAIFTVYEWDVATNNYKEYKRDGQTMTLSFQEDDRTYLSEWLYSNRTNLGKFRIVETGTPDGYFGDWSNLGNREKVNNDIIIDLNNNGQTVVIDKNETGTYTNKRVKGTINVNKIDKETNRYLVQGDATLDGAVYGLYAAEEIVHKDTVTGKLYDPDQLVDRQTIVNGQLTFNNVEIGRYYIKEITPPKGYTPDNTKYEINMNYEGEAVEHLTRKTTVKEQVIKQAFTIQKLTSNSSMIEPLPLEGAGFKVYLIRDLAGVKNGSIVPDANGKYRAEDFYGYDFSNEQTALDYSSNQEGERIEELYSNEEGRIQSPELAYGQYVIKETTVPEDRYEVSPFIVEVKEDNRTPQGYRFMIDEEFEALIRVNKYDSTTEKLVLNKTAGYRIWDVNNEKYVEQIVTYPKRTVVGTEENPYRINDEGYFITPLKLQIGEYELREVEAPNGYVRQGYEGKIVNGVETKTPKSAVRFKVKMNTAYYQDEESQQLVIDVNQYNDPMVGELKIEKQGEFLVGTSKREDGTIDFEYELRKVEGTEFDVYAKEEILTQDNQGTVLYEKDGLVGKVRTNTEGIGYLDNLPIGKYYIKETEAGEGFALNKEIKEFEVKYQGEETPVQEIEVDYTNERQKAEVNDNRGLIIEKVTEKIVYKPGEEVTYIIKVSNTGDVEAKNINVTETKINGVFDDIENENIEKVDDKTIIIKSLKPGESVELTYRTTLKSLDEIDTKIEVTNVVDAKGEVTVPDPENPGGTKDEDIEAEDKKDIVVTDKDLVVYKEALKESYAPGEIAQYLIHVVNNGTEKIKNINVSETMLNGRFVELEESQVNGIKITYKKTEEGEDDLNNVIIDEINPKEEVTLKYEYLIPLETEYDTKVGNDVKIKGTILIPNSDDPDNPTEKEVEDEDSEEITIKEDDNMLGIVKTDSKTGERVAGAVIGIYAKEDIKISDGRILIEKGTLIEKVVTDEQGKGKFTVDLPLGMYYVQEIEAPEGYLLSTEQIDVDLRYKGQDQETITVSHIISDRRREIRVDKLDEEGKLLVGAELEIVDENGEVFAKWTTGEEGQIIDKLEKEKVYTLRETSPAKGYTTAKEIKFYIGEDEKLYQKEEGLTNGIEVDYLVMKDTKTKIKIEVKDKDTGENVPGIKVDIVDKTTGEVVDTVVTTEDGADIEGLPVGDYELRIEDPENRGYVTDKTDITVEDTPEEQKYEMDADYIKVEVGIKDEETGKLLPGGKIEVLDEEGNVVTEIETEDMSKLDRLPPGKYTLHETEAPKGYWPSEDVEIEVKDTGERQTFTLTNKRKIFDMSVEKKLIKQVYNGVETDITGNLSKFEIRPQNIGKAEFWTIYTVTVKNTGEIEGKATVKELIPDGFEMYQESNLAWKVEGNEATLTTDVIQPGKSLQYEVALRWKQSVLNIGIKENKVLITSTDNEFGFKDKNEDGNNSSASILVALSTGLNTYLENATYIMLAITILGIISIIIIKIHSNKKEN